LQTRLSVDAVEDLLPISGWVKWIQITRFA